ncbi:TCR/Tet family MFS transporter [Aestuariivirga litoralis]|uniref:TCR/Tet family MFS transporter n=1 Tax=Aestuariivirga litoralis TaxID=2650924 RepID=UPI0018C544BB|nr:TCR/Tet family MFS transporter [Aestuariivirga litoralis]MBG1230872.1 TCR/Tet family MFS transporter [Aestuariivirga litoralis]
MTIAPTSKYATLFIFVTVLLDMVGFGLVMPVQPALIQQVAHVDLGTASLIGGFMFFAFSAGQFLLGPTLGNLSDAYGRRRLLLLAVFGLGCDFLITAMAPNITWLFIGRTLAGVCGASYVIANAFIADVTPPEGRAKAFGMMGAAFGLGFVIGPAIGGLLGTFGPRVPFYVAAAISLLNFAFGYFILPETLPPEKRRAFEWKRANPFGTLKIFAQYRQVLPLCGILGLYFFATSVYPAIWPFWGTAKFGWSSTLIGVTLAAFGIIMAFTQGVLTGPLVKRFGEWNMAIVGLIAAPLGCIIFALAPCLTIVIMGFFIHAPEGFVHPMVTAIMSKEVPEDAQGELQGGLSSIMNISMMMGTVFYGVAFDYFVRPNPFIVSAGAGFLIAGALTVCTLLLALTLAKPSRALLMAEK